MKTSIRIISLLALGSILLLAGCSGGESPASRVTDTPTDVPDSGNLESSPAEESPEFSLPEGADEIVEAELTLDFNSTNVWADGAILSEGVSRGIGVQASEDVIITGTLDEDSKGKEFVLMGKLYPFSTGIYSDRIIVGDFVSENDDFSVRRVAVDTEYHNFSDRTQNENVDPQTPFISIYLDNNSTGDIIYLQTNITQENYDRLLGVSQQYMGEYFAEGNTTDEYNKKVVGLYLGSFINEHQELLDTYVGIWLREEE